MSPSSQHLAHLATLHSWTPPSLRAACRQVTTTQHECKGGRLELRCPANSSDLVNVPVRTRAGPSDTSLPQAVRSEPGEIAPLCHACDYFGPCQIEIRTARDCVRSERNNGPRSTFQFPAKDIEPVEQLTPLLRIGNDSLCTIFVFSGRMCSSRCAGSCPVVSREQISSRRSAAS